MCGIAGGLSTVGAPVDHAVVTRLTDDLQRRGPDGSGLWCNDDGVVSFGHRRLAIIGLGPQGAQPLVDASGRYVITFNGEIYNYRELRSELESLGCRFTTDTDTEVVVRVVSHWGEAGLARLRGMYAFALWDDHERECWLVRDPFGIKPLYWSHTATTTWFSSQARPLARADSVDSSTDPAALAGFYQWGHVPEPFTWWTGIRAFPPGHVVRLRPGHPAADPRPFLQINDYFMQSPQPLAAGELAELLRDSVSHHLVADIPVGAFLSAGVDSTLLALLAAAELPRLSTVTLAFEEFRGSGDDEAPLAEATAAMLGTDHTTWRMTRDEFEGLLDEYVAAMDQPTIDGLNSYCVSWAAAQSGLKVALSGLGADELFGGYPSFTSIPRWLRAAQHLPRQAQRAAPVARKLLTATRLPAKAADFLSMTDLADAYVLRRSLNSAGELDALLDRDWLRSGLEKLSTHQALHAEVSALELDRRGLHPQISLLESSWYMRNQLLRDTDWASMAHGLEVRVPFLDLELLRHVAPATSSPRPPDKGDLANISPDMPSAVANRPKSGFGTPVQTWLDPEGTNKRDGMRKWAVQVHGMFASAD